MLVRFATPVVRKFIVPVLTSVTGVVIGTLKNEYDTNQKVENFDNKVSVSESTNTIIQEAVQEVIAETQYDKPIIVSYENDTLMRVMDKRNMGVFDSYSSTAAVLSVSNADSYAKPENKEELKNTLRHEIGGHLTEKHPQKRAAYQPALLFGGWGVGRLFMTSPAFASAPALCVLALMITPMVAGMAALRYLDRKQETEADNAIAKIDPNGAKQNAEMFRKLAAKSDYSSHGVFGSLFEEHPSLEKRAQNLEYQADRESTLRS